MDRERLERYRRRLLGERRRYSHIEEVMSEEFGEQRGYTQSELSNYDNHPADMASETFEREKDYSLLGNVRFFLEKIDNALERIDEGTYGTCERCGAEIGDERLDAMPMTTLCKACKEAEEANDGTPDPNLEALFPPFGRSFTDETNNVGYDGEDAWQEVARYGTSDSPQDDMGAEDYDHIYRDADELDGIVEEVEALVDENGEPIINERSRRYLSPE
ncbi:MAG: TraR/DksA C4-type zinc finger protein [Chloroflexota bacterium]